MNCKYLSQFGSLDDCTSRVLAKSKRMDCNVKHKSKVNTQNVKLKRMDCTKLI